MTLRQELNERVEHLRSISPNGAANVLDELALALNEYCTREGDFSLQLNKTLDKVIADEFHTKAIYEHQELIDPWFIVSYGDEPVGYFDLRDLIDSSGVLREILTVSDQDFKAAFYTESEGSHDGINGSVIYKNRYVEKWKAALSEAKAAELEGLKAIMQYCANRAYGVEYAFIFEETGKRLDRQYIKDYAKKIFYEKGYGWIVELFELPNYKPSYYEELKDNGRGN